jgi:hypothetical protein
MFCFTLDLFEKCLENLPQKIAAEVPVRPIFILCIPFSGLNHIISNSFNILNKIWNNDIFEGFEQFIEIIDKISGLICKSFYSIPESLQRIIGPLIGWTVFPSL